MKNPFHVGIEFFLVALPLSLQAQPEVAKYSSLTLIDGDFGLYHKNLKERRQ